MGCASSAPTDNKAINGKGGKVGAGDEEPAAPKQNPYMTLTHREIFQLKMSWKGIRRSLEETGVAMFILMFEACPDTKNHFEKFKNMSNDQLSKYDPFINHVTNVMESLDLIVTELDDADKAHDKLKKIGTKHKTSGIPDSMLLEMKTPFLKAVEQTLGDRYSDRMRVIYEVLIDYFIKAMTEGYA